MVRLKGREPPRGRRAEVRELAVRLRERQHGAERAGEEVAAAAARALVLGAVEPRGDLEAQRGHDEEPGDAVAEPARVGAERRLGHEHRQLALHLAGEADQRLVAARRVVTAAQQRLVVVVAQARPAVRVGQRRLARIVAVVV